MIDYSKNLSLENLFYIDEFGIVRQEEWKYVKGSDDKYQVSNLGRVKTFNYRRDVFIMTQESLKSGYKRVRLWFQKKSKRILVHVLVCQEFLEHKHNPPLKVIDHIDDNPKNNILTNLRIISFRENIVKGAKSLTGENNIRIMKKKYQVRFVINKKTNYFGCYETLGEAVIVRNNVKKELETEFKKHLI